ncbi:MAG: DUF1499 domain-containing protein, partial [Halieaceae bacterium]
DVADQQATAYPDIAPLETGLSTDAVFERALEVAGEMGWEIVATDPSRLRFEATARTPVFYFADDIVVAVTPAENGSRVDMRGVSRVGAVTKASMQHAFVPFNNSSQRGELYDFRSGIMPLPCR